MVNLVSAWLLSDGHHHGHGDDEHHHHDHNLRSAYFHVLADALTSALAIIALLAGQSLGWRWLDSGVGIVGALVIARWSWGLMRDPGAILPQRSDPRLADEVRPRLEADGDVRVTAISMTTIAAG